MTAFEVFVDNGGVNMFHVCFDVIVVYGVCIYVGVCGFVYVVCLLRVCVPCCVVIWCSEWRCSFMGSMLVSSCRCWMLYVRPVAF